MALIDALMAGQQFVSGIQQQRQMAREYRDRMAMLARDEERAMRQEERQMMSDFRAQEEQDFRIELARSAEERAKEDFRRQGVASELANKQTRQNMEIQAIESELGQKLTNLEISAAASKAALDAASAKELRELENVQRQIIQFQRIATQNPSAVTADMFNAVEQSTYNLIEKYPSFAGSISPLYASMVDAANFAIKEGRPTQLTESGASQAYGRKYTTVGREAGKIGGSVYSLPSGPNLRAGMLSSTAAGATVIPGPQFESGRENILDQTRRVEQTMNTFPNFLGLIGAPYASALMDNIPNK